MNLRPSGYEPDELPDCSIPRYPIFVLDFSSKADDRTRTDNLLITNQLLCQLSHIGRLPDWQVGGGGFEPPKQFAADLQSVPFGHSGICPFLYNMKLYKADDRTRTDNLLITNQLLCQLSHIGISRATLITTRKVGPTGLEPVTLCL